MRQQRTGVNVAKKVFVENENGFRSLFQESAIQVAQHRAMRRFFIGAGNNKHLREAQ